MQGRVLRGFCVPRARRRLVSTADYLTCDGGAGDLGGRMGPCVHTHPLSGHGTTAGTQEGLRLLSDTSSISADISPRLSDLSRRLLSIFSGISGGIEVLACLPWPSVMSAAKMRVGVYQLSGSRAL